MLEEYEEMPVFISMDMMEDMVELGCVENLGELRSRWLGLRNFTGVDNKFWGPQQKLHISVKYFVDWMANYKRPWATYRSVTSG